MRPLGSRMFVMLDLQSETSLHASGPLMRGSRGYRPFIPARPFIDTDRPLTYDGSSYDAIKMLFRAGLQWNDKLECIRDGHRIYVPEWGPLKGFTEIDYFHGLVGRRPLLMAQLADDQETDLLVTHMRSAMPGWQLHNSMTTYKKLWISWKTWNDEMCLDCGAVLHQKLRWTSPELVDKVLIYLRRRSKVRAVSR